jgi:hypothetical protein
VSTTLAIGWRLRAEPLAPTALFAEGNARAELVSRLLACSDVELSRWSGIGSKAALVLVGSDLPWADGVVYLGTDPRAPGLFFETLREPTLPIDLVSRALLQHAKQRTPLAVIGAPLRLIPLGGARPLERAKLLEIAR